MGFVSERVQASRSGRIASRQSRIEQIKEQHYVSDKDQALINKLRGKIARDEKLNQIAKEKADRKANIQASKAGATRVDNSHNEINYTNSSKKGINDVKLFSDNPKVGTDKPAKNPTKTNNKK